MSAIDATLSSLGQVARDGDLRLGSSGPATCWSSRLGDPIVLQDGKRIYSPRLHGEPIDELTCALIDTDRTAESTLLPLFGPAGAGNCRTTGTIAYRPWQDRGREVERRHGARYGFVEISGGLSSDECPCYHEFVPAAGDAGTIRLVTPRSSSRRARDGFSHPPPSLVELSAGYDVGGDARARCD